MISSTPITASASGRNGRTCSRRGRSSRTNIPSSRRPGRAAGSGSGAGEYIPTDGRLQFLEGFITDITARKKAETLLRTQYDLGKVLSTVHGLTDTLEACLDSAIRISDLDAGGIYIVDDENGSVDLAAHKGLPRLLCRFCLPLPGRFPAGSPDHEG